MKSTRLLLLLLLCVCLLTSCTPISLPTLGTPESTETKTPPTETSAPQETEPPETEPPTPKKRIAITFDDGPSRQGLTEKLVDEFAKYGGKATFFVLGNLISNATGECLAYADEKGCEIAIHAYTHEKYFDTCSEQDFLEELELTQKAIEKYIDSPVTLLRPPGGRITESRAVASGYPIVLWSIDSADWKYKSRADEQTIQENITTIVNNVLSSAEDGDIVLMHEIYMNSYEATCRILAELHERGFEFVTVTELLGSENLTAGKTVYQK
jgi:peptidoglycan/xylan/chitin deacetylase (PgdA/CDA1 family)